MSSLTFDIIWHIKKERIIFLPQKELRLALTCNKRESTILHIWTWSSVSGSKELAHLETNEQICNIRVAAINAYQISTQWKSIDSCWDQNGYCDCGGKILSHFCSCFFLLSFFKTPVWSGDGVEVGLLPIVNISVRLPDLSKHLNAQSKGILQKVGLSLWILWYRFAGCFFPLGLPLKVLSTKKLI